MKSDVVARAVPVPQQPRMQPRVPRRAMPQLARMPTRQRPPRQLALHPMPPAPGQPPAQERSPLPVAPDHPRHTQPTTQPRRRAPPSRRARYSCSSLFFPRLMAFGPSESAVWRSTSAALRGFLRPSRLYALRAAIPGGEPLIFPGKALPDKALAVGSVGAARPARKSTHHIPSPPRAGFLLSGSR